MAFDFPPSPTDGEIVTFGSVRYKWLASAGAWTRPEDKVARTRGDAVAWLAAGGVPVAGQTYWLDDLQFIGAPLVTTTPADLPGLVPAPEATYPDHFLTNAIPGATDMTAAINAASAYIAGLTNGGTVHFRVTTYFVSGTVYRLPKVTFRGVSAKERSILKRTGAYGHTVICTGRGEIHNLQFDHGTVATGATTALDYRLTDGSCHVYWQDTGKSRIVNCGFNRMPYNMILSGAQRLTAEDCDFAGTWSEAITELQETLAGVLVGDGLHDKNSLFKMINCRIEGTTGPEVPFTVVDGSGNPSTRVLSDNRNWGPKWAMEVRYCEQMTVTQNYIARGAVGYILYNSSLPASGIGPSYGHKWTENEFDGDCGNETESYQFLFDTRDGTVARQIIITDNNFIGGNYARHAIYAKTATVVSANTGATINNAPTVYGLTISDNSFHAHVGAPIVLLGAKGMSVTGNTITGWNAAWLPDVDKMFCAAIVRGQHAKDLQITGNTIGGGGLTFAEPGTLNSSGQLVNRSFYGIHDMNPTDLECDGSNNKDAGVINYLQNTGIGREIYDATGGYTYRWSDGKMVAVKAVSVTTAGAARFLSGNWNYENFLDTPIITCNPKLEDVLLTTPVASATGAISVWGPHSATNASCQIRIYASANFAAGETVEMQCKAEGRWKAAA